MIRRVGEWRRGALQGLSSGRLEVSAAPGVVGRGSGRKHGGGVGQSSQRVALILVLRHVLGVARRLPVIQTPAGEDAEAAERPAWQWVLLGAAFLLAVFFPLALLAVPLGVTLAGRVEGAFAARAALTALPVLFAFSLAAGSAGAVIGRFGLRARHSTAPSAGALGAAVILLLTLARGGLGGIAVLVALSLLLLGAGAACAWFGARFGERRRPGAAAR